MVSKRKEQKKFSVVTAGCKIKAKENISCFKARPLQGTNRYQPAAAAAATASRKTRLI